MMQYFLLKKKDIDSAALKYTSPTGLFWHDLTHCNGRDKENSMTLQSFAVGFKYINFYIFFLDLIL